MKRFRGRDGAMRLWLEPDELEQRMESELDRAKAFPSVDAPAVEIEQFVEGHLEAQLDQYADLDASTLGLTEFRVGARPKILINKDLTGSALDEDESPPGLLGRWRATVAHEAAHVILHRCLFNLDPTQRDLFGTGDEQEDRTSTQQRCLKRDVAFGSSGKDWREIQANMGMAALLMPRLVFVAVLRQELQNSGRPNLRIEPQSKEHQELAARLAASFKVSKQAASIRFHTLGLLSAAGQVQLL